MKYEWFGDSVDGKCFLFPIVAISGQKLNTEDDEIV